MYAPPGSPERLQDLIWIPISAASKAPRVKFKNAQVSRWKSRAGDGYGVLTGPSSSELWVWALDLDTGDDESVAGGEGRANFDRLIRKIPGASWDDLETFTVKTRSGGLHYYFLLEPGKWVKGSAGKKGNPNLDEYIDVRGGRLVDDIVRGTGYVKAPPSDGYEVVKDVDFAVAPDWLYELVKWEPPVRRTRTRSTRSTGHRSPTARLFAMGGSDPIARAKKWVKTAEEALTSQLEELWDQNTGWREVGLRVTASLAGLVEHDLLADLDLYSEDRAWELMTEWSELMDDGEGFYDKHLEPMFLGKLGNATPAVLADDLEDALLAYIEDRQAKKAEAGDSPAADDAFEDEAAEVDLDDLLASNLETEPPRWLIQDWIMGGELNLLTGAQKSTKSTIATWVASRAPGAVAWFAKDGEHLGNIKTRLEYAGISDRSYVIPDSMLGSIPDIKRMIRKMAEKVGTNGLLVIDSLAGVNRHLDSAEEYSQSVIRDLWTDLKAAANGTSLLVIAHGSSRDTTNVLMGAQAIHQILAHLMQASNKDNVIEVTVPFSRYMLSGTRLATGQLPIPDPADQQEPVILDYSLQDDILVVSAREDGLVRLVQQVADAGGIDEGAEISEQSWPDESGLSWPTLLEAEGAGLIYRIEGVRKGKFAFATTRYFTYLRTGSTGDSSSLEELMSLTDDEDW